MVSIYLIVPNSNPNANPNPSPNSNWETIFLGGNCPGTLLEKDE